MDGQKVSFVMFIMWSVGIIGINIYLTAMLQSIKLSVNTFLIHFIADIGVSATAGMITYLLAKTLNFPDIYLVMIAAIIGHLSARVAYKSSILEKSDHKNINDLKRLDL